MDLRPIRISIKGAVPTQIMCPTDNAIITIPEQTDGNMVYRCDVECACGQKINLECRL